MVVERTLTPLEQRIADVVSDKVANRVSDKMALLIGQLSQVNSQLALLVRQTKVEVEKQSAVGSSLQEAVTRLSDILSRTFENPEGVATQKKLVVTAGTAVQLPDVLIPYGKKAVIKAISTNTDEVYVANSKADAEDSTKRFPLSADDSLSYKIRNLSRLWINSAVSGEGVTWTVEQK